MAEKSTIANMYDDLINAFDGIVERNLIFPGGRPDIKEPDLEKMPKYIVVELPVNIEDYAAGNNKYLLTTTGVVYLFSKAKKNRTFNVNALSDFTEAVTDKFPISGEYIAAANPTVLMNGTDEFGYQLVTVSFDIHSK
jgi:hypothetical protein